MDRLDRLQLFVRIAEGGGFARAAAEMGLARSTASEAIKALERDLGARLLTRTTRHVAPTPEGESFLLRARAILADLEEAEDALRQGDARGHLRVDAPGLLTRRFLIPALPGFLAAHPGLSVEFRQGERLGDLVREGVDCALRVGEPQDSGLIQRRLGVLPEATCASPAYLAAHGTPASIDALEGHCMVGFVSSRTGRPLPLEFLRDGRVETRRIPARAMSDSADANAEMAQAGLGIIQAPRYRFAEALARGEMVELFAQTPPSPSALNAVFAQNRQMSRRLSVFLDWAAEIFAKARKDGAM